MPAVRMLQHVVGQLLLGPACGCRTSALPARSLGASPWQIPANANFHSASFSETDQPRVLITGWVFSFFPRLGLDYFRFCAASVWLCIFLECLT